jgi:hypothetical protein
MLCHSVQHTIKELGADLGLPAHELDYRVVGINHVAFFLRLEHDGEHLYPRLHDVTPALRQPRPRRAAALRLLRHRVARALRRVLAGGAPPDGSGLLELADLLAVLDGQLRSRARPTHARRRGLAGGVAHSQK